MGKLSNKESDLFSYFYINAPCFRGFWEGSIGFVKLSIETVWKKDVLTKRVYERFRKDVCFHYQQRVN